MKINYKYFRLEKITDSRNEVSYDIVSKKNEFLGELTKEKTNFVFVPFQYQLGKNREYFWYLDCLEDLVKILGELNA